MNFDMSEFRETFFEEAAELLDDFEAGLLRLEDHQGDPELLNTIFRCAHSIKGGSATFGLPEIAQFTHHLETLLDKVRSGQTQLDPQKIKLLFESLDHMKAMLSVSKVGSGDLPSNDVLMRALEAAADSRSDGACVSAPKSRARKARGYLLKLRPGPDVLRQGADVFLLIERIAKGSSSFSASCDSSGIPSIESLDPEACHLAWEVEFETELTREDILETFDFIADASEIELFELLPEEFETREDASPSEPEIASVAVVETARAEGATLRVAADKLDRLINLVGELVINQSMLTEVTHGFTMARVSRLYETVAAMERASRELQERAMAIRLVPIRQAFSRFPRLVRDLAATCGKQVELKMSGEDTELDKTLIEALADPLTHLVRNSVDHGLELPEQRAAAGKPEMGAVRLRALQEGGNIVIEISDDGRGLDREKILAKAQERGLVNAGEEFTDEQVYGFIFEPGFSTAAQITDVSGRGVGLDIVRQALRGVNGSIGLTSVAGKGTTFRIRLPLTMAILEGLSLAVGDEVYVLPLTSIVESIQPNEQDVHVITGREEVVRVRGDVLPLVRLYSLFEAVPKVTDPSQGLLVIVENDGRKAALLVDELIGQSQVVIKSVERNHQKVDGIAGATILGDGRVALILDVPQLLRVHDSSRAIAA